MDKVTIPEYNLLVKAARLRNVDKDYRAHQLAYLTFRAKDRAENGKRFKYTTFDKFYDARKAEEKAMGGKAKTISRSLSKAIGDVYRKHRGKKT